MDQSFTYFMRELRQGTVSPCTACNSVPKKTHLVQNYTVQGLCLVISDPKISTLCKDHTNKSTLCKVYVLD